MTFWTRKQKSNIPDALKPWARGPRPFELLTSVPDGMSIPKDWDGMLGLPVEGRVAWINNCLERVVGTQLRETIHYLRSHLVGVDLMREGPDMGILYSIESDSGRTNYWCGGLPLGFGQTGGISTEHYNSSVGGGQLNWSRVPEPLKRLYELHDGFGYYTNGFGFPSTRGMIRLGNEDLGIVETLQLKPGSTDRSRRERHLGGVVGAAGRRRRAGARRSLNDAANAHPKGRVAAMGIPRVA